MSFIYQIFKDVLLTPAQNLNQGRDPGLLKMEDAYTSTCRCHSLTRRGYTNKVAVISSKCGFGTRM